MTHCTRIVCVSLALCIVSGCGISIPLVPRLFDRSEKQTTVADLTKSTTPIPDVAPAVLPDTREVLALYKRAVASVQGSAEELTVRRRIAELSLAEAVNSDDEIPDFGGAVAALQELSALPQPPEDQARTYYQLAQAYEMQNDGVAAQTNLDLAIATGVTNAHTLEARFRRAEVHFSSDNFVKAAEDYSVVAGTEGAYTTHANYMLGWSRFKSGDNDGALTAFLRAADLLLTNPAEAGGTRDKELLADVIRITLIAVEYEGGVQALDRVMYEAGSPDWQLQLYKALSDRYLERERFQDSVAALDAFLVRAPLDAGAPAIALSAMTVWRSGGFVEELAPRKASFIDHYAVDTPWFERHGWDGHALHAGPLREFIDERCATYHAAAQSQPDAGAEGRRAFTNAATCYRQWLANFPEDPARFDTRFLLAESLLAAADVAAAVVEFGVVATSDSPHARASAYAVVVGLESLATVDNPLTGERVEAAMFFADRFSDDPQVPEVVISAANLAFEAGDYAVAGMLAGDGLANSLVTPGAGELWRTATLILGHSKFELADFAEAEAAYLRLLAQKPRDKAVRQRALAAVFQQGDVARAAGDLTLAIGHLDRLMVIDPKDALSIAAMFDVASLFESLGQLNLAAERLEQFRKRFPRHEAVADIPKRLVALYESTGESLPAARELLRINKDGAEEPETRRLALYRAGELLLEGGNHDQAIATFRDYAHTFVEPVALRLEAMNHMDELYQVTDEPIKRRFWLRKIMTTVDASNTATGASPRGLQLAADAAMVLAQDSLQKFAGIRFREPLARSVKAKQKAMKAVIYTMQKVASYGVAGYVTAPTFHIGASYEDMATGLMAAPRPRGLNELESEQYDILLEEQAFPFEEQAIEIHKVNVARAWAENWDEWTEASLQRLAKLSPGLYLREEQGEDYVDTIY